MVRQDGLVFWLHAPALRVQPSTVQGGSGAAAAQPDLPLHSKITGGLCFSGFGLTVNDSGVGKDPRWS